MKKKRTLSIPTPQTKHQEGPKPNTPNTKRGPKSNTKRGEGEGEKKKGKEKEKKGARQHRKASLKTKEKEKEGKHQSTPNGDPHQMERGGKGGEKAGEERKAGIVI